MQLFSRKKVSVALSIGALFALGACGDDITVTDPPPQAVVISITPQNVTLNIGESTNLAVQITGGTNPTLASCTSSNTAVATAAVQGSACRVTAVAAGNVSVTAAASTGNVAAAAVTVAPAQAAINTLTVSPSTTNITVGQKGTLVPNVNKAAAAVTVAYTYATSSAAIATVAANGEVTAVAPGTATITVTATGSGTGYTTTALTTGATVVVTAAPNGITTLNVQPTSLVLALGSTAQLTSTVSQPAGAAQATITYGSTAPLVATVNTTTGLVTAIAPGTAVITVTATSAANAAFSATTLTQLVPVTVTPSANVTINSINQGPVSTSYFTNALLSQASSVSDEGISESANSQVNQPVDINNVRDQIQLVVNLQPNNQRVDSVVAFIANADGSNRRPAARQLYSNGTANAEQITLYINTADFTANFAAGTADVFYPNGQKIISVSVFTTEPNGTPREIQNASNNRQTVNFNNLDGYAGLNVNPARVAQGDPSDNSKANLNWWGGPGTTGEGNTTVIPVFYTPGRTLRIMEVTMLQGISQATTGIFTICGSFTYNGPANPTPSALPYKTVYGVAPAATYAVDCSGYEHPAIQQQDFLGVTNSIDKDNNPGPRVTRVDGYRRSAQVLRPISNRLDYRGPSTTNPDITRERPAVTGWVNASFNYQTNTNASYDYGVGVQANSRAWQYVGCAATMPTAMPTATGADIPECATNFIGGWNNAGDTTQGPYRVSYNEKDRLTNNSLSNESWAHGVDKTVSLTRWSSGTSADTSVNSTTSATPGGWQLEFIDERSGFVESNDFGAPVKNYTWWWYVDVNNFQTNGTTGAQYPSDRAQTHILVQGAGYLPAANYATRSQCLVPNPATTPMWSLSNGLLDPTIVFPAATFLSNSGCSLVNARSLLGFSAAGDGYRTGQLVTIPEEGIYRYSTRVSDRAGNLTPIQTRTRAFDITRANFSALNTPLSIALGGGATFAATYEDRTEVRAGTLKLLYPTGAGLSINSNDTLIYSQALIDARFNDNINGPNTSNLVPTYGAPFVTALEHTDAGGNIINSIGVKADRVTGTMWDARNQEDQQGAAGTPRSALINGSALANPTSFLAWVTANPTLSFTNFNVLSSTVAAFNAGTGLKAQVTATTNTINSPFTRVDFYRLTGAQRYEYIGSVAGSAAIPADQGSTRYWTYLLVNYAPLTNNFSTAQTAAASFDNIVAVGVRTTGEGLVTPLVTVAGSAIDLRITGLTTGLLSNVLFTNGSSSVTRNQASAATPTRFSVANSGNWAITVFGVTGVSGICTGTASANPAVVGGAPTYTIPSILVTYTCPP